MLSRVPLHKGQSVGNDRLWYFAHDAVAAVIAGVPDRIEFGQGAPHVRQYRLAPTGEPNPSVSALEQCKAELILKSINAAADRRGVDPERLGGAGKVSGGAEASR